MADNKKGPGLMIAVKAGGPPPVRGLHEPPSPEPDADEHGGATDNDADDPQVQIQAITSQMRDLCDQLESLINPAPEEQGGALPESLGPDSGGGDGQ